MIECFSGHEGTALYRERTVSVCDTAVRPIQMIEVVARGVPKEDIKEFIPLPQNCQNWTEQLGVEYAANLVKCQYVVVVVQQCRLCG